MADETETGAQIDVVASEAPAEAPAAKKQRAPRRSKAEIAAAAAAKSPKVRQKRNSQADALPVSAATTVPAATKKTVAKGATDAKPVGQPLTPLTASDEMTDLLQLEEENKKLRQALAEKLRAENADLRKRLGV